MVDFRQTAAQIAGQYGIPVDLFLAQINQESGWNPAAVSSAGAIGLGQLMPGTARDLGVDPTDPVQNLTGAARYLSQQYKKFGDWDTALAAYNAGPGAVQKYGGIPPYKETQNYVKSIMGRSGSGADVAADTMAALGKGNTMTPMAPAGQQQERKGFLGGLLSDPDLMDRLAIGLSGMSLNPNVGLQQVAANRIASRAEERKAAQARNATADQLDKIAPGAGDLVRAGIFSGAEALKFVKDKESMALAQQASEAMARGDYATAYSLSMRLSPTAAGQAIAQQLGPRQPEVIGGGRYTTTYVDGKPVVTPNEAVIEAERRIAQDQREAERIRRGLPTTAQKAEEEDFDALGAIDMISAETARIERLFGRDPKTGEFKGPLQFGVSGLISGGLGSIGFGEGNEKVARAREDYETFKTKLVNESLRLNKGVQTEGDAQRAMNELGGARTTAEAYAAIQKLQVINDRARQLRERAISTRRERYNMPEIQVPQYAPTWEVIE